MSRLLSRQPTMNIPANFAVTPLQPAPAGATHGFALAGTMDAHCADALRPLARLAPESKVVLDFALVTQVNSMGLAQFLRLLEAWRTRRVQAEAVNLNRMTSVLFKMTGLNRYFTNAPAAPAPRRPPAAPLPTAPVATPDLPALPERLDFQVSAQSINQMNGWFFCNNYVQRKLAHNVRIDVAPPAQTFDVDASAAHLLFVKPFDACHLIRQRGYRALVRPVDDADEVVIVSRAAETRRHLTEFAGARVATALAKSFVYLLGRHLCDESGLDSSRLAIEFTGNEIKGLMQLLRGQVDLLFMLQRTYRELSDLSRRDTRVLDASQTQFAYHLVCADPAIAPLHEPLRQLWTGMANDPAGAGVLRELDVGGWVPVAPDELDMLTLLYDRYATEA